MGKVITMYGVKEAESPVLERLRELDRKRNLKMIADYEKQKRQSVKEKRTKQS